MFCKHCGKEIDDNSEFCKYCGKQLVDKQKIVVEFNKPKAIDDAKTYLEKLCEKYRLFFNLIKKNDELWFFPFIAIVCIVWLFFITAGVLGFIMNICSINSKDIPFYYCTILVIIEFSLLLNWFVNYYNKKEHNNR